MNSVQTFYLQMFGNLSAFTTTFLTELNLQRIQDLMTAQLQDLTGNPEAVVTWTDAHLEALVAFAHRYRTSDPTVLPRANWVFADQMALQNETHYRETRVWRRWCAQGIPDPNNLPLPLPSERTDYTVETSDYMLDASVGLKTLPTC